MNENDAVFDALKEILPLFALIAGMGALVAGVILSVAALLHYVKPVSRWRKQPLGW